MATLAQELLLLPQIVSDVRTTNCLTLAAFVVLTYDMILTLNDEMVLLWRASWNGGKILYFLNRYPAFITSVFLLGYMFDYYSPFHFCVASNYIEAWSMLAFTVPVQLILILRTYALWEKNRKILWVLVFAFVATDITIITSIAYITKSLSFSDRPGVRPALGCFGVLNDISTGKAIPSWAALMIFDTTVFVLTLLRLEKIRREKKEKSRLLNILFRDGIAFYIIMLSSSIANLAVYAGLPLRRRGLIISLVPLVRSVMSVCTARLLLNLRGAAVEHKREHWAFGELELNTMAAAGPGESVTYADRRLPWAAATSGRLAPKHAANEFSTATLLSWQSHSVPHTVTMVSQTSTLVERGTIVMSMEREAYKNAKLKAKLYPGQDDVIDINPQGRSREDV